MAANPLPHPMLALGMAASIVTRTRTLVPGASTRSDTLRAGGHEIQLSHELGHGAYGVVHHGKSRGGTNYAVKHARTKTAKTAQHEAAMLDRVSGHKHVVPYMGMAQARSKCYVLTGLCEGGSLQQHIEAGDFHLRNAEVRRVFLQLISAVKHCHQRGVAHRDLKPDNILALDSRAETYCLADFGIASDRRQYPVELTGTFAYMAPECLGSEYWKNTYDTHSADVWSLGIILVKMITGRVPWKVAVGTRRNGDDLYREYLRDRFFIGDYLELAEEFLPLLHRILEPSPAKRISIDDLEKEFRACKRFSWSMEEIQQSMESFTSKAMEKDGDVEVGIVEELLKAEAEAKRRAATEKVLVELWRKLKLKLR
ncbi:unnamed protein product [Peniophora sp. CBMAI 1063]|nr:unnamed protein product [Peniophora sp. CBMAI 1063]